MRRVRLWGVGRLLEDGRQGDADGAADRVDGPVRGGAQQGAAAVLLDLDFAEVGQVVQDGLPFERRFAAPVGGEAIDQFLALRIPTEPATCTDLKAATYSDPMPAGVPI
ncbi:hypothetical protein BAL199_22797 [alpha proteobacterium BAL199]|nr:hypothetical protein BAL199_22797 [alpha proteobacterium BAL199]